MEKRKFNLIDEFRGFITKGDETKLGLGIMVAGSRNVQSTNALTIASRQGYSLDGSTNSALTPIESSFDWLTSTGTECNLKAYDDELRYRYVASDGTVTWRQLADSFTVVDFNFISYWDTDEVKDICLFVNGSTNVFAWSGGITTVDSVTANTIKKEGTETWAEARFILDSTNYDKKIIAGGITYTYTGGETTTTLTGVSPSPVGDVVNGDIAHQAVTTIANTVITGLPNALKNDLIGLLDNQVYIASESRRTVYISKINDFTNFSYSSPRLVGEGALLTLDGNPNGFVIQEQFMYISVIGGWFQTKLQLSSDNLSETLTIDKLKTAPQQNAKSQSAIANIKNDVVFISGEPTLDTLGRVQNLITPQSKPLSDPIKPDFNDASFGVNTHIKYFKNNIYVAIPADSELRIFNIEKGFWEPPWDMPAGRLAIIGGELYLHSNATPETYKLFQGYNDNNNAFNAVAKFSYDNSGFRFNEKKFEEFATEGYISPNTILTRLIEYDYKGNTTSSIKEIKGDIDQDIIYVKQSDANLGKKNLGKQKLAGKGSGEDINKFRVINEEAPEDYYEKQVTYSTNDIDQRWELLCFGDDQKIANYDNNLIKQ